MFFSRWSKYTLILVSHTTYWMLLPPSWNPPYNHLALNFYIPTLSVMYDNSLRVSTASSFFPHSLHLKISHTCYIHTLGDPVSTIIKNLFVYHVSVAVFRYALLFLHWILSIFLHSRRPPPPSLKASHFFLPPLNFWPVSSKKSQFYSSKTTFQEELDCCLTLSRSLSLTSRDRTTTSCVRRPPPESFSRSLAPSPDWLNDRILWIYNFEEKTKEKNCSNATGAVAEKHAKVRDKISKI